MTAAVPDKDGLRKAIAYLIRDDSANGYAESTPDELSDALLAAPLAALLAERDDLAAKVAAVRELANEWHSHVGESWWRDDHSRTTDLRRALGDPS